MTMKEVDLRAQHIGETGAALVDVVMAAGAAEQFSPRRFAGDFECGRHGRNAVGLFPLQSVFLHSLIGAATCAERITPLFRVHGS
jgi:hypothetical protein